jgi:branched-chain amino acid transport system ATP-binding protein
MSLLKAVRVGKDFMKRTVLEEVSFELSRGECVGLIGPNGAGKTTLANIITGFLPPDRGTISIRDEEVRSYDPHRVSRKGIRRTFQLTRNFPRMTVLENVLVAASAAGLTGSEAREQADALLQELTIDHLAESPAGSLSGGQQKLLELAACFVVDPDVVILDEPFAAVHPTVKQTIRDYVIARNRRGSTFLIVSHDITAFRGLTPRLIAMAAGRVLADGELQAVLDDEDVIESYLGGEAWHA